MKNFYSFFQKKLFGKVTCKKSFYLSILLIFFGNYAVKSQTPNIILEWARHSYVNDSLSSAGFAIDADGCIFVSGVALNTISGTAEIITLRYNAFGDLLWSASFPNSGADLDNNRPKIKAAENCGVIVGFNYVSAVGAIDYDIVLVKYDSTGVQQWATSYNGPGNGQDWFTDISLDNIGNVYVSGSASTGSTNKFLVIKYNDSGVQQWTSVYNNPSTFVANEMAISVIADTSGNIYATGYTYNSNGNKDYTTIKYDASGNEIWVAVFNGQDNLHDYPSGITVDNSGNIIVTGSTQTFATGYDFATIKYDDSGAQQWIAYYDRGTSADEIAVAVKADDIGNIFITGNSGTQAPVIFGGIGQIPTITLADAIVTIKYDTLGNEQWNIPEFYTNSDPNITVYSTASTVSGLALDSIGNIYIGGYIYYQIYNAPQDKYTIGYSFIAKKYTSQGNAEWGKEYSGTLFNNDAITIRLGFSFGLALQQEDEVYMTGGSAVAGVFAITTIKFSPCLITADAGQDVTINQGETVQIGSISSPNVTYSWEPTDDLSDPNISNPVASPTQTTEYIITANIGSVCFAKDTVLITVVIPPPVNDSLTWIRFYSGPDSLTDGALAIDAHGHIYVAGISEDSDPSFNPVLIKYDKDGNQIWDAVYNNPTGDGFVKDVAATDQCEAYIAGFVKDINSVRLFTILKYDSSGTLQWAQQDLIGEANALQIADDGSVYATGYTSDVMGSRNMILAKFSSMGQLLWSDTYDNGGDEVGEKIALDSNGNIYIAGPAYATDLTQYIVVIKYDAPGNKLWTQTYNADFAESGILSDILSSLSVTPDNNIVVASNKAVNGYSEIFLLKYDENGNLLWNIAYGDANNMNEYVKKMTVNSSGQIIITGIQNDGSGQNDILTAIFSQQGNLLWNSIFNGVDNLTDEAGDVSLDDVGNIYVSGFSESYGGGADFITLKYDSLGQFQWQKRYNGSPNDNDFAMALKAITNDEVYVAGIGISDNGTYDFITIKYGQSPAPCNIFADAGPDATIFAGQSVQIGSTPVAGNTYSWSPGESLSDSTIANPIVSPVITTIFTLIVTNNSGCVDTDKVTVHTINVTMDAVFTKSNILPDSISDISGLFYDNFGNIYTEEELQLVPNSHGGPHCTAGIFQLDFVDAFVSPGNPSMVNVFCQVFTDISELIVNSQCNGLDPIINISIGTANIPSMTCDGGPLAGARLFFNPCFGNTNGIIDGEVWKTINSGINEHPNIYDASIEINFDVSALLVDQITGNPCPCSGPPCPNGGVPASWNYNMNANPGITEFDAYSIILHEAIHTLGFGTLIGNVGQAIGAANGAVNHYSRYDTHLRHNPTSNFFINWNGCYYAAFGAAQTNIESGCSNVEYKGINAGVLPVYAPDGSGNSNSYQSGRSLSHFFINCGSSTTPDFVMHPWAPPPGSTRRIPADVEVGVLCDLGYQTTGTFGDGTLPFHTANTGIALPLCGERVAGVSDGLPDACNTQTIILEACGDAVDIDILANDINAQTFDCAQITSYSGGANATFNTNGTILNFVPLGQGVITLTYIPVGPAPNFQRGSAVCVKIFMSPCDGICGSDAGCNQICNHDLSTIPVTDATDIGNLAPCWMRSHGSPQTYHSTTPPPPNDGFILTFAHSHNSSIHKGEGVLTWVDVCPDKNYIFSYFRKKVSIDDSPNGVYNNYPTLHNAHGYLLQPGNTPGIPTISWGSGEFVIPAVPATNFHLLHEQDITSEEWEQAIFCFSTQGLTDSYKWLWLYPEQPDFTDGVLLLIDDVELLEDNFTAGVDKTINCGQQVTIGEDICTPHKVTYQWTIVSGDANSIIGSSNGEQCIVAPSITTVYQLTRTFPVNPSTVILPANQGCTLTTDIVTVTVLPDPTVCCVPQGITIDDDLSFLTTTVDATYSGQNILINGTYTVNHNIIFSNCTLYFGPNAKIDIPDIASVRELRFKNCLLTAGCNIMWDGIYVRGTNSTVAIGGSVARDAENLIVSEDGGIYNIGANYFYDNHICIKVNEYVGAHQGTIWGTTMATLNKLIPPRLNERTAIGMEITDVEYIEVGISANAANTFSDIDVGIKFIRNGDNPNINYEHGSSLIVKNNIFQNIKTIICPPSIPGGPPKPCIPSPGVAIWAMGPNADDFTTDGTNNIIVGGPGTSEGNEFNKCGTGIFIDPMPASLSPGQIIFTKTNLTAEKNKFFNILPDAPAVNATAIYVRKTQRGDIIIKNHTSPPGNPISFFKKVHTGIKIVDSEFPLIDINNNEFNKGAAQSTGDGSVAIAVMNAFPPINRLVKIRNNTIQRMDYGIRLTNYTFSGFVPDIDNNNILLNQSIPANPPTLFITRYGILIENSRANVHNNQVRRTAATPSVNASGKLRGIQIYNSPFADVIDNRLNKMGVGLYCKDYSDNSQLECNIMTSCTRGIVLDHSTVGDQGDITYPQDNQWFSSSQYDIEGNGNTSENWYYRTGTSLMHFDLNPMFPPPPNDPVTAVSLTDYTDNWDCSIGCLTYPCPPQFKLAGTVQNPPSFASFVQENQFLSKEHVFTELRNEPLLMQQGTADDVTLQQFHDSVLLTNMGKIREVHEHVGAGNLILAEQTNNSITPQNLMEENHKKVNDVYLRTWAKAEFEFDSTDKSTLEYVAYQRPIEGGRAVYTARVMLDTLLVDDLPAGSARMANPETNENNPKQIVLDEHSFVSKIYPIPNNGNMQIDYRLNTEQEGEIIIYDFSGKIISSYKLLHENTSLQIKENLANGVYHYRIFVNKEIVSSEKLVIIR